MTSQACRRELFEQQETLPTCIAIVRPRAYLSPKILLHHLQPGETDSGTNGAWMCSLEPIWLAYSNNYQDLVFPFLWPSEPGARGLPAPSASSRKRLANFWRPPRSMIFIGPLTNIPITRRLTSCGLMTLSQVGIPVTAIDCRAECESGCWYAFGILECHLLRSRRCSSDGHCSGDTDIVLHV